MDTSIQIHREFSELLHQWTSPASDEDSDGSSEDSAPKNSKEIEDSPTARKTKSESAKSSLRPIFKLAFLKYLDLRISFIPNEYLELLNDVLKDRVGVRYVGDVKLCY